MDAILKGFGEVVKTVTFRVRRFDPEKDKAPRYEEYKVPVQKGMTVLDGILYIKENLDHSLSARYSCRMG
ncbi:MAG: 2Fe-2S iron-sulfur cluster-binding protein, partial [Thermoplasmatales archaeon]